MNKLNLLSKLAIAGIAGSVSVFGIQVNASAFSTLTPPDSGTFGLYGYSVFGDTDGMGGQVCQACDSTTSFMVYTTLGDGDWTDDPLIQNFPVTHLRMIDPETGQPDQNTQLTDLDAKYVLFYNVKNTNPLGVSNPGLENFNVTKTAKNGDPYPVQPYTSAGYIDGHTFAEFSMDENPINADVPNNWIPTCGPVDDNSCNVLSPFQEDEEIAQDPDNAFAFNNFLISSPSVRNGQAAYYGAGFEWSGQNLILPDGYSSALFLTVGEEDDHLGIIWGETESPNGFGASGDIVGVKNKVPEPGTVLGLLAVGGLGLGLKRKKQS